MDDPRFAWVAANIAAHCNAPADVQSIQQLSLSHQNSSAISAFLDTNALALFAFMSRGSDDLDLVLTTDAHQPVPPGKATLAFTKQSPAPLTDGVDMDASVLLCSMTANVAACLFHFIRNVYTPMLSSGTKSVGANVQTLLSSLDAALTSEALTRVDMNDSTDLSAILMPLDEVRPARVEEFAICVNRLIEWSQVSVASVAPPPTHRTVRDEGLHLR